MADLKWLDEYLRQKPGTEWDYKPEWGWDRYRVAGKLYAATCLPGPSYAAEYAGHPLLTLKCDPLESELLRAQYPDILPGFYTDKRTWISIRLDGAVERERILALADSSYALVVAGLTRKARQEIMARISNDP